MHVCVVNACMCAFITGECGCGCIHEGPKEDIRCPDPSLSALFLWEGSLTEPGTRLLAREPQWYSHLSSHPSQLFMRVLRQKTSPHDFTLRLVTTEPCLYTPSIFTSPVQAFFFQLHINMFKFYNHSEPTTIMDTKNMGPTNYRTL